MGVGKYGEVPILVPIFYKTIALPIATRMAVSRVILSINVPIELANINVAKLILRVWPATKSIDPAGLSWLLW